MLTSPDTHAGRARRRTTFLVAAVLTAVLSASTVGVALVDDARAVGVAASGTITYIQGNNVFVAAQDGSNPRQVTSDGTPDRPYYSPTESDDGHIVAGRGELIYRMDQWGYVLNTIDPPDLKSGGGGTHGGAPQDVAVSPDGAKIAYTFTANYCSGGGYCRDWPVTAITASTGLTDPGVYGTTYGEHPSWVTNTRIAADTATEYGNLYLFELGRGTVGSDGYWFDDTNLRLSSHRILTDLEIARQAPYATVVRGKYDQAEILLVDLSAAGNYIAGIPGRTVEEVCNTWEELGFSSPSLSPDGSVLAWDASDGVWTVPTNGGSCGSADLAIPGAWAPSFSPAPLQATRPTYPPPPGPSTPAPTAPTSPSTPVPTFTVKSAPKVAGKAKVGKKLKATGGALVPKPTTVRYQWTRDKKAIKGATKSTYKVTRKDRRHRLAVRITGIRPGYKSVASVSKPVRIKG